MKELIGVVVSQENECSYCTASHRENLFKLRVPGQAVLAVAEERFEDLDELWLVVAEFARYAAASPNAVTDDIDALREVGFNDEDVMELLGVVGLFMAANTYASAMGVDPADRDDVLPRYVDFEESDLDELATLWRDSR